MGRLQRAWARDHAASKSNQRPWCSASSSRQRALRASTHSSSAGSDSTTGCRVGGRRAPRRSNRRPPRSRSGHRRADRAWPPTWPARTGRARGGGRRWCRRAASSVASAASSRLRNGSIIRRYGAGQLAAGGVGRRRAAGMWECSPVHSEVNPRSSSARASSAGCSSSGVFIVVNPSSTGPPAPIVSASVADEWSALSPWSYAEAPSPEGGSRCQWCRSPVRVSGP